MNSQDTGTAFAAFGAEMDRTLDWYNRNASEYAAAVAGLDMEAQRRVFLGYLGPGATILDAGCGSGRDSAAFLAAGYDVTGLDASPELAAIYARNTGRTARIARLENFEVDLRFDGVWCCAALLHMSQGAVDAALGRLRTALRADGILYLSVKYGDSGYVGRDGRYFNDFTPETLCETVVAGGFAPLECWTSVSEREMGTLQTWVNLIARRTDHSGEIHPLRVKEERWPNT
jgi:SAM-dependent methyltransferase